MWCFDGHELHGFHKLQSVYITVRAVKQLVLIREISVIEQMHL